MPTGGLKVLPILYYNNRTTELINKHSFRRYIYNEYDEFFSMTVHVDYSIYPIIMYLLLDISIITECDSSHESPRTKKNQFLIWSDTNLSNNMSV